MTATASSKNAPKLRSIAVGDFIYRFSNHITNLFPVWTVIASLIAMQWPATVSSIFTARFVKLALSFLMLSTGLTLTLTEVRYALRKPFVLLFAFAACYGLMPLLALGLARVFALDASLAGGLILLGIMSGGQASNLCTLIAGGDVALSVAMTTLTTMTAAGALPFLSKMLLGTMIPVNTVALAKSTAEIVLVPILVGIVINGVVPSAVRKVRALLPVLGIAMVIVLILGPVARTAPLIQASFGQLLWPVLCLHVLGGVIGYAIPLLAGGGEQVAITTGFETGFKSPALSYVLAMTHFQAVGMRVPSAISIIVLAPVAALCAVLLKMRGPRRGSRTRVRLWGSKGKMEMASGTGTGVRAMTRSRWFDLVFAEGRRRMVRYDQLEVELRRAKRAGKRILAVEEAGEV